MSGTQKVLSASEPWAEYQLEDGTLLRFRLTACNFRKTGKTTDQGDPEYSFSHQMQCETIPAPVVTSMWSEPELAVMRERLARNAPYQALPQEAG